LKDTVLIIKASSWKAVSLSRNHPEYTSILNLAQNFGDKFRFILVGTTSKPTNIFFLKKNILAWDLQQKGRLGGLAYYFGILRLLLQYRPNVVITLGLLNIVPVSAFTLLSWKTRYVPIFIGEFGYYRNSLLGKLIFKATLVLLRTLISLSQRRTILMFALSRYIMNNIEKLVPAVTGRVALISYPIHPMFCQASDRTDFRTHHEPILLTVAGIEPRKGLDTLIASVPKIRGNCKVLIKGTIRDAQYFSALKNMVASLGLNDRVVFDTELVDYDRLVSYYESATLFVFPTREDCLGVVVLEALHCGLPVIATDVGGIPDMIKNGSNGILVPPDNADQLANAISLLLNDETMRNTLASNGRKVLNDYYYRDRMTLESALTRTLVKGEEGKKSLH
jgi:glycosyltransferase involved in cell wall biosynthesis